MKKRLTLMFSMPIFSTSLTTLSTQQKSDINDNDKKIVRLDDYNAYESLIGEIESNSSKTKFKEYNEIDKLFGFSVYQMSTISGVKLRQGTNLIGL